MDRYVLNTLPQPGSLAIWMSKSTTYSASLRSCVSQAPDRGGEEGGSEEEEEEGANPGTQVLQPDMKFSMFKPVP